jgi:hypothetical protein
MLTLLQRWFGCLHRWRYHDDVFRTCDKCKRTDRMEPDAGGWTAGQWNRME